ncbi:hypothetical protein EI94DRAFT_1755229, partial [Lactarius quietus]
MRHFMLASAMMHHTSRHIRPHVYALRCCTARPIRGMATLVFIYSQNVIGDGGLVIFKPGSGRSFEEHSGLPEGLPVAPKMCSKRDDAFRGRTADWKREAESGFAWGQFYMRGCWACQSRRREMHSITCGFYGKGMKSRAYPVASEGCINGWSFSSTSR